MPIDTRPQQIKQLFIPSHVAYLVGQMCAMSFDKMCFYYLFLADEFLGVEQRALLLKQHEPDKHGEQAGPMRRPVESSQPAARRLNKMEVSGGIELRSTPPVQLPEHFAVPTFLVPKLL